MGYLRAQWNHQEKRGREPDVGHELGYKDKNSHLPKCNS